MKGMSRREFVRRGISAGVAVGLGGRAFSQVLGSNDAIRVAVVGLNEKGSQHVEIFREIPGVHVAALCDVDSAVLGREVEKFHKRNEKVDSYIDFRQMLEDKSIDAVVIATPNHWHSLMGIWSCAAGKDVYVEKPVSHDIWEGRQLVFAAKKYGRIVQAGLQSRSDEGLQEAVKYVRQEMLGPVKLIQGFCYKRRPSIGKVDGPQQPPSTVDYDLWCGPGPKKPIMRKSFHYDWHWDWDYGNGDVGNQGCHELDMCRWFLGTKDLPLYAVSFGGRFGYEDDGVTPNTMCVMMTWDNINVPVLFEVRGLPRSKGEEAMDAYKDVRLGVVVECERGYFVGGNGGGVAYDKDGKKLEQFKGDGGGNHQANFIRAMRDRSERILNCPVEEGHLSACLSHIANVSYRIGKVAGETKIKRDLMDVGQKPEAYTMYEQMMSHLKANEVNMDATPVNLGKIVTLHGRIEKFLGVGAKEANAMAEGKYRAPYVMPKFGEAGQDPTVTL